MKLHATDGPASMQNAHRDSIFTVRQYPEIRRLHLDAERMVTSAPERRGKPGKDTFTIVVHAMPLPMNGQGRSPGLAAEDLVYRLHAQTHAQRGNPRPEVSDYVLADASMSRIPRPWRDADPMRLERLNFVQRDRVVSMLTT